MISGNHKCSLNSGHRLEPPRLAESRARLETSTLGHMKEQWVDFVKQFDKNVLEADRKQAFK